ncbi:hypothetical protein PUR61_29420, partial [Streptomyces sp. BE20]|uniref:hypothetical protein n=1 Tax=Streptomyces sp. BE20 TaxID=3002525 RepID=UPI002E7665F5
DGSPRSWQEVLGDVARLAGMAEQPADDPCRTVARWHAWLADRRVLLRGGVPGGGRSVGRLVPTPLP